MTANILSSDGTALANPHFYYSRGVGGDDIAIMRDRNYVKPTTGQLWERLAETTLNQDALTGPQWSRMAIARNFMGTRHPALDGDVRGSLVFSENRGYNSGYSYSASGTVQYGILAYSLLTRRPNTNTSGE